MALTLDITEITRLRRAIDRGAALIALVLFVEATLLLAVVAKGDSLAFGLAIPIGVVLVIQARMVRGGAAGFMAPGRVAGFAGLILLFAVLCSIALRDWIVIAVFGFWTLILGRRAQRAIHALLFLRRERSRLADPSLLELLVYGRPPVPIVAHQRKPLAQAKYELAAGIAVLAGLSALFVFEIMAFHPLWLALPASILVFRGRRRLQLSASELTAMDRRSPVLILRAFEDDPIRVPGSRFSVQNIPVMRPLWRQKASLEEVVAHAANMLGPPLIIGEPGERLPRLGASREYVSGNDWRIAVQQMMEESRLLVFILGDTENLRWEFRTGVEAIGKDNILIIVPPLSGRALERRWQCFVDGNRETLGVEFSPSLSSGSEKIVAVFFAGNDPVFVLDEIRIDWSYLVATWLFTALAAQRVSSADHVEQLARARLPSVLVTPQTQ